MGDEADLGDLTWGQASRLCRARCCEPRRAVKRAFSKGGDRGGALHACLLACLLANAGERSCRALENGEGGCPCSCRLGPLAYAQLRQHDPCRGHARPPRRCGSARSDSECPRRTRTQLSSSMLPEPACTADGCGLCLCLPACLSACEIV